MRAKRAIAAAALIVLTAIPAEAASAEPGLAVEQLVEMALEANPQAKAARARWKSAEHSITQNYAPADPTFTFLNVDSPTNRFDRASVQTLSVTESFQFPGKAMLQANAATRAADIARLAYVATLRDIRAQTEAVGRSVIQKDSTEETLIFSL